MFIDGMKMFEKNHPHLWQSKITIRLVKGFTGLRFSKNLRNRPLDEQEYSPAIVWIKNDEIVHYLLFVYMEHQLNCFRGLLQSCYDSGATVIPSHNSLVGRVDVIFTWEK